MNIIPYMNNPQLADVLKYVRRFPCSIKAENIILNEISKGNTIINVGDAGCMPDETVVVIKFAEAAKEDYPEMKVVELRDGSSYKRLCFSDNSGAVEFRFADR